MGVGEELVEETDDDRVVGQLLQGTGDVVTLALGEGFWIIPNPFGVASHVFGLGGLQ